MTPYDFTSKAVQSIAALVAGAVLAVGVLFLVASLMGDMLATAAYTIQEASDGVRWEGEP